MFKFQVVCLFYVDVYLLIYFDIIHEQAFVKSITYFLWTLLHFVSTFLCFILYESSDTPSKRSIIFLTLYNRSYSRFNIIDIEQLDYQPGNTIGGLERSKHSLEREHSEENLLTRFL